MGIRSRIKNLIKKRRAVKNARSDAHYIEDLHRQMRRQEEEVGELRVQIKEMDSASLQFREAKHWYERAKQENTQDGRERLEGIGHTYLRRARVAAVRSGRIGRLTEREERRVSKEISKTQARVIPVINRNTLERVGIGDRPTQLKLIDIFEKIGRDTILLTMQGMVKKDPVVAKQLEVYGGKKDEPLVKQFIQLSGSRKNALFLAQNLIWISDLSLHTQKFK